MSKTIFEARMKHSDDTYLYSCFEKGRPTKPHATMPKGLMGNEGSWSCIQALVVSAT